MSIAACPVTVSPTGVVVFEPALFSQQFPQFATVGAPALQFNFQRAALQLNNSCGSRVTNASERELLLLLLTAHVTALTNGVNGQPPAGIVGHVSHAQQGSVSVSASVGTMAYGQAYYMQTQWGAEYWQATAKYRTMRYIPAPAVCADFGGLSGHFAGGSDDGCGC